MNEQVKQKVDELKALVDTLSPEEINQIIRGERPKRIKKEDFKVFCKTINNQIRTYLKGRIAYPARVPVYDKAKKSEIIGYNKVSKPYIKEKK
jgi:hypothetical protein